MKQPAVMAVLLRPVKVLANVFWSRVARLGDGRSLGGSTRTGRGREGRGGEWWGGALRRGRAVLVGEGVEAARSTAGPREGEDEEGEGRGGGWLRAGPRLASHPVPPAR